MPEPIVAIAGCGAISAVGCGIEPLSSALKQNLSGLRAVEKFNPPRFQSNLAGAISDDWWRAPVRKPNSPRAASAPENSHAMKDDDPAWFIADEAIRQARESAQRVISEVSSNRIGLVLATTKANIVALERISSGRPCSEAARRHLQPQLLAADLAIAHGALGLVQTVSLACVSGLAAISQGAKFIQRGEADAVLVVGVDCLSEFVMAGFTALKALDPLGCRPFDRDRSGLSPGEAGAAIVLAREEFCGSPALIVGGFGSSNDANHLTGPSRDGSGLALAIRSALASAQLLPAEIDYVHAHGTGTGYNDAMESLALRSVFGDACPPVSGSKGMLGHTLGAAGVVETLCCVLAMQNGFFPGTPRLNIAAEGTPSSLLREPRSAGRLKNVLKLNTGFGGINGALILRNQ